MYQKRSRFQLNLLSKSDLRYVKTWSHGGQKFNKRRKIKRPLVAGKSTHVIFKSAKAKGRLSLLTHKLFVNSLLRKLARKYFVTIQDSINMGNHLHLKVKFKDAERFRNFMRVFAALTARQVTGARKGVRFGRFWDGLVFTRVIHSKFDELQLNGYLAANLHERDCGVGAREHVLDEFNQFLRKLKGVRAAPS